MKGKYLVLIVCILFSGLTFAKKICTSVENVTIERIGCLDYLLNESGKETAIISFYSGVSGIEYISDEILLIWGINPEEKFKCRVSYPSIKIKDDKFRFFSKKVCNKPPQNRFHLNGNLVNISTIRPFMFLKDQDKSCVNIDGVDFEQIDFNKLLVSKAGESLAIVHVALDTSGSKSPDIVANLKGPEKYRFFNKYLCPHRDTGNNFFQIDGQTYRVKELEKYSD